MFAVQVKLADRWETMYDTEGEDITFSTEAGAQSLMSEQQGLDFSWVKYRVVDLEGYWN